MDALFEATGLVIAVMSEDASSVVHSTARCAYCDLSATSNGSEVGACLDECPRLAPGPVTRTTCRVGLPCYVAPLRSGLGDSALLVVGGFVSSTRDRKRLFEKLLGRGVPEAQARLAVRDIPILPQRQVEALVRMARVGALSALDGASASVRYAARERELDTIVEAGSEFAERRTLDSQLLYSVVDRARQVLAAPGGALLLTRPGTEFLEVVASAGRPVSALRGRMLRLGSGLAGGVARDRRTVLIAPDAVAAASEDVGSWPAGPTVFAPILNGERLLGMLVLELAEGDAALAQDALGLVERYARLAGLAIDNARVHGATERAMFELMHIGDLAKSLSGATEIDDVVSLAADVLERAFKFDIGGIVLTGWGYDRATAIVRDVVNKADIESVTGEAAGRDASSKPFESLRLLVRDGSVDASVQPAEEWLVLSSELFVRDAVVGYAFLAARGEGAFGASDQRLLAALSDHIAFAMERSAVLQRLRDDLTRTIAALSATLDATEHASHGHSDRVTDYAMLLGEEIGLGVEDVELLRFAGLLHDVGKTGISEEILLRPSRLTEDEMAEVRRHAEMGASIVEQIEFLGSLTPVIMHHHERWDGEGYPMRLKAEEIPLLARVLAVADAFDAMTSESVYRKRLPYAEARRELVAGAGTQFDPTLVSAFLELMDRRALAGSTGLLDSARKEGPQLPA